MLRVSGAGQTLGRLEPGIYVVAGAAVPGYSASPSQRVTVVAGRASTVTLLYTAIPGVQVPPVQARGGLTISLSGLATGSSVDVIIDDASTGAKKVLRVASTGETLGSLDPGVYTIAGAAVPGYSAPPVQRVAVTAGGPTAVTLTYTAIPGVQTPPSTSAWRTGGQVERLAHWIVGERHDHIADWDKENAPSIGRRPDVRRH